MTLNQVYISIIFDKGHSISLEGDSTLILFKGEGRLISSWYDGVEILSN